MGGETLDRILYVEDEPDIQAVAKMALELVGGFTLCVCSSGQEALDRAAAFGPDLVLLDVMMPGMDGPSTLKALRAMPGFEAKPVVFMTAKAQPQEIRYFKDLGALDVITKPFDPMALPTTLKAIWDGRG
jgi:two-component system OmpR family response regulator